MSQDDILKTAYKKTFKLALAVSIIRSKPTHLSAKEYAQQLANDLRRSEVSWKSKFEQVSLELVETKQQMVLLQLKNESILQDLNLPTDERKHLLYNNVINSADKNEMECDVPPSVVNPTDRMALHGKFLSSVSSFKQWNVLLQQEDRYIQTIRDSIEVSLKEFDSCLEKISLNEHNLSLITDNVQTIVEMTKKEGFTLDERLCECCSNIVRSLIKVVMNSEVETELCEKVTLIIVSLAQSCSSLRDAVLENLVNVTIAYSTLLSELVGIASLDVAKYQNMFFICEALKDTFLSTYKLWPNTQFGAFSSKLDSGIMSIANTFPMYAHTVWVTSSLMADAQFEVEQRSNVFRSNQLAAR